MTCDRFRLEMGILWIRYKKIEMNGCQCLSSQKSRDKLAKAGSTGEATVAQCPPYNCFLFILYY